jgi:hypothetical protein
MDSNIEALDNLICQPVERKAISYIASLVKEIAGPDLLALLSPNLDLNYKRDDLAVFIPRVCANGPPLGTRIPSIEGLAHYLLKCFEIEMVVVLGALVYLRRFKSYLSPMIQGNEFADYGILITSIIVSAKYMNDHSFLNMHWAICSTIVSDEYVFSLSLKEINSMEVKFLDKLGWNVHISLDELVSLSGFLTADHGTEQTNISASLSTEKFLKPDRHPFFERLFPCTCYNSIALEGDKHRQSESV